LGVVVLDRFQVTLWSSKDKVRRLKEVIVLTVKGTLARNQERIGWLIAGLFRFIVPDDSALREDAISIRSTLA
jgi:hypothetical protein